jgi:photosystem II stability/assembly factor-like uncharacterized protein
LAADESGGFVSNNGGQSWLAADIRDWGLSVAAHPYTPTVAYLGGRCNVYKTTDGGSTWVRHELPGLPENNAMRVHAIAVDPNDTRLVYTGAGNWDFAGGPEYGWLYRSLDAGDTWNALTVTFPISPVTDIMIDPSDSQTIYVATGRRFIDNTNLGTGVLKSIDGGESWTLVNQGFTTLSISRLAINPSDSQMLYAGANPRDSQAGNGVFKTVDGGSQWTRVTEWGYVSGLEVDPLVTSTVYAGSYSDQLGVFRSTDAGVHWESVSGALGHLSSQCLDVTAAQSRTIVYAGIAGGVVNLPTADSTGVTRATVNEGQFYGSGVYQLTIDRRHRPTLIYLPLIMKN